ncbi:hypothetical protein C8R43DRAFT_1164746 [Mycena crocata]|nr:hypothetical protein C8R43DRAFT_1164746 [Mycena crocata]
MESLMEPLMERPYIEQDLEGLKHAQLVALVKRQIGKWKFTNSELSKAKKEVLVERLMDPQYGFTTNDPLPESIRAANNPDNTTSVSAPTGTQSPDNAVAVPTEMRTAMVNVNEPVVKEIQLLIADVRSTFELVHTSRRIKVKIIDTEECQEGEWRANSSEILFALQNSIGKLDVTQSARVGVPDRLEPTYTEYFVHLIPNEPTENLTTNPPLLIIPKNNRLHLRVHRNVDRVEYWRFAFNVNEHFARKNWPPEISTRAISKTALQLALNMGQTALAEAVQMIKIIDCYTTQGANYSAEVLAQIGKSDDQDPSATILKNFLQKWQNDHPVQN